MTLALAADRRLAIVDGCEVRLSRLEAKLLAYLMRHEGKPLLYSQIASEVWGYEHENTDTIRVTVWRLRQKLGRGIRIVNTVDVGYMLVADWPRVAAC